MKTAYIWLSIAITVLTAAAGDVLLALAMRRIGELGELRSRRGLLGVIARVFYSGLFFAGVLFMAIAFFSNLLGLSWADLSLMGPATAALTFIANAVAAKFVLEENVDYRRWLATIFVCCGVFLLT